MECALRMLLCELKAKGDRVAWLRVRLGREPEGRGRLHELDLVHRVESRDAIDLPRMSRGPETFELDRSDARFQAQDVYLSAFLGEPHRAFAEPVPRARPIDRLAVGVHPAANSFQDANRVLVQCPVRPRGNVEHEVPVLADDVNQLVDDRGHRLVTIVAAIEPIPDRVLGLPWHRVYLVQFGSLVHNRRDVVNEHAVVIDMFYEMDAIGLPVASRQVIVVKMCHDFHARVAGVFALERNRCIEIHQLGMVMIDQVLDPGDPEVAPRYRGIERCTEIVVIMSIKIQVLIRWVFPVVWDARAGPGAVGVVAGLEPAVRAAQVSGDPEDQSRFQRGIPPESDDVLTGSHLGCIPAGVLRVPEIEVIMVDGDWSEILRPGFLEQCHERVGIEPFGFPELDDVLVAKLGGVTVMFHVILVCARTLDIHVTGIPAVPLRNALGSPMAINTELQVTEPRGASIPGQRFPGCLKPFGFDVGHRSYPQY